MPYSKWLKVDLHIHSHESNKTKTNDYEGPELTFDRLFKALKKENVNLFSITDHNTINISLYSELIKRREELIENNINFIIGAEVDFIEEDIHDDIFHMLVYFDTYDLEKVSNVFKTLYQIDNLNDINNITPVTLWSFFDAVFKNSIQDIITIPHFNNKHNGLPTKDQIDKFVYTVFNALEDSNNRKNLVKSIKIFKEHNYTDVPVVVFSDNHNIDKYPCGKSGDLKTQTCMYILGNLEFSFNSIKMAFQDVSTRVSIEDVQPRKTKNNVKHVKSVKIDNEKLCLSEYQNTIIGGFGAGKSFLINMIYNGKDRVDDKYKDLAQNYRSFVIEFSDCTTRSSLSEVEDEVKIIRFEQYKDIYFKDILLEKDKNELEKKLHIEFPSLETIKRTKETDIIECVNSLKINYDESETITDIINYEAIARRVEKKYTFKDGDLQDLYEKPAYLESLIEYLKLEIDKKVLKQYIYKDNEKESINLAKDIIRNKNNFCYDISNKVRIIIETLNSKITSINNNINALNERISSNIKILENIKEDLRNYISLLVKLKSLSLDFEMRYSEIKFNELAEKQTVNILHGYKLVAKYMVKNKYPEWCDDVFKSEHRKNSFFQSTISTLHNGALFKNSHLFDKRIDSYTKSFYCNFENVCYDIIDNNTSIMKKSAGEKANAFIKLIFNIVEYYSKQGQSVIIILDQPEDNLDNKGIQKEVVERIRYMKINNCLPQIICVTHNANISITADSENIILARKEGGKCCYTNSGIEDINFINDVCMVIEGGVDALKKRGIKFNIPIIKNLERGV